MPAPLNTSLVGDCVLPFYDWTKFPDEGGFIAGRTCANLVPGVKSSPYCCLPCPVTDWVYSDDFDNYMTASAWLNVGSLVLLVFLLISYLVLPAHQTKRHYLSACLAVSCLMMTIGFTIPLSAKPEQCYNEITPNDMHSSMKCAWSGTFVTAGALSLVTWVLLRSLSITLQICFNIVPGRRFFYGAQAFGWGVPAVFSAATLAFSGLSFRFGGACHANHTHSLADFWGPMLAMAGAACILQLSTLFYCMKVYLSNVWCDQFTLTLSNSSPDLPLYSSNLRTKTARAIWRRLEKVLWLQWRSITLVTIILVGIVYFIVVFIYLDDVQGQAVRDETNIEPWIFCLIASPTDKALCLPLTQQWLSNQATVIAALILVALCGLQLFFCLTPPTIFRDWVNFFCSRSNRQQEFVSVDAKNGVTGRSCRRELLNARDCTSDSNGIELEKLDGRVAVADPGSSLSSPSETYQSPIVWTSPSMAFNESPTLMYLHSPPVAAYGGPSPGLGTGTTPAYFGHFTGATSDSPVIGPRPKQSDCAPVDSRGSF